MTRGIDTATEAVAGMLLGEAVAGMLLGEAVAGMLLGEAVAGMLLGEAVAGMLLGEAAAGVTRFKGPPRIRASALPPHPTHCMAYVPTPPAVRPPPPSPGCQAPSPSGPPPPPPAVRPPTHTTPLKLPLYPPPHTHTTASSPPADTPPTCMHKLVKVCDGEAAAGVVRLWVTPERGVGKEPGGGESSREACGVGIVEGRGEGGRAGVCMDHQ